MGSIAVRERSSANLTIALLRHGEMSRDRFTRHSALRAAVLERRKSSHRVHVSDHLRLTPPADRMPAPRQLSCDPCREPGWPWDTPMPSGLARPPIQPDNTILRIVAAYEQRPIEPATDEVGRMIDVTI